LWRGGERENFARTLSVRVSNRGGNFPWEFKGRRRPPFPYSVAENRIGKDALLEIREGKKVIESRERGKKSSPLSVTDREEGRGLYRGRRQYFLLMV